MITVKTFSVPISKLCEVRYYVVGRIITDAHFTPESEFVVDNRYFNTKEEAEQFKKQCWEETPWIEYEIREEILKIFDQRVMVPLFFLLAFTCLFNRQVKIRFDENVTNL